MSMKSEKFNLCGGGKDYCPPTLVVEYVFTESGFATSDSRYDRTNGTEIFYTDPYYELQ
mgnify:FL=1